VRSSGSSENTRAVTSPNRQAVASGFGNSANTIGNGSDWPNPASAIHGPAAPATAPTTIPPDAIVRICSR
jgi:hypothetical protein